MNCNKRIQKEMEVFQTFPFQLHNANFQTIVRMFAVQKLCQLLSTMYTGNQITYLVRLSVLGRVCERKFSENIGFLPK